MTPCLLNEATGAAPARVETVGSLPGLRLLDALLAGLLLALLALPLLLALRLGRMRPATVQGLQGRPFQRLRLRLPGGRLGRAFNAVGAAHWPVLVNILRGDVAFVGPRLRRPQETVPAATLSVRPGLVNPWFIRCRTAVAFGTEAQADADYLAQRGLRHDLGLLLRGVAVALLPAPAAVVPGRVRVGDVAFDNVDMNEAITRLGGMLEGPGPHQVSFVNPACVNIAARHRGYRRVLARAALVLPDGIGIKIGSDLLGTPLKQNVNGTDLFPRLCDLLLARGASLFLLGGQAGVAEAVAAEVARRWPGLRLAGVRDGYFSVAEEGGVAAQVRASGADVLLVARGVPSQDLFIDRYLPLLGVKVAMGVGGLFDFVSGRIARAPMWMRETGLEWVYRLMQEPGRMWRRYLVGNLSFLARVALQRIGLRRPAVDALPPPRPQAAAGQGARAVVFATAGAPADVPVDADQPLALLPLGSSTVIERLLAQLSQAAVADVDIVVCDRPEALRQCVGDGARWGLRVRWHLVKDPQRPYGVLHSLGLQGARRVLIGHADQALALPALLRLAATEQVCLQVDALQHLGWSGWASVGPEQLAGLACRDGGMAELAAALQALKLPSAFWTDSDALRLDSAARLLRAQFADDEAAAFEAPASWIRRPWGAMSPQARVAEGAVIRGPVLIGPGCIVERGAIIGPHVVLGHDVVVSAGSHVERSLVLPYGYIGADLDINQAIVNGPRVRHLRMGVETTTAVGDALLYDLRTRPDARPGLAGRALAAAALLLVGPALLVHRLRCHLAGHAPAWVRRPVVIGRAADKRLKTVLLRCPAGDAGPAQRRWAALAALIDIVGGHRGWLGVRPRGAGEWYALRPEWQALLAGATVGLLHAPAWSDGKVAHAEACAAADVLHAVLPRSRRVAHLASARLRARRHATT